MARRGLLPALVAAAVAFGGCSGASSGSSSDRGPADLRLPRGAYPSHLYLARDGSLWITESIEAVARRLPNGKLRQYRLPGDENSPGDLEEGPDGAIWIAGFEEFIRIDPEDGSIGIGAGFGPYANPEVGLPRAIAPGPDGQTWIATEGASSPIVQVPSSGAIVPLAIDGELGEFDVNGLALGSDRAVWMTLSEEFGGSNSAIGRLSPDGDLRHWTLPGRSELGQIVSGPDGALWFTESSDHRIGRITTDGEVTEIPLRRGLRPNDIAPGLGNEIWFTTQKRVGRVGADMGVRTWRLPGADYLFGIAPAAEGGVWVADGPADRIHYFEPPL